MKLSQRVKPISYLKSHAPEIIQDLSDGGEPVIVTVRGEAKAILQDVKSYENTQETLALLKILALGEKELRDGKVMPAREAMARVRRRVKG